MSLSNSFDRTIAFAELSQGRPESGAGPQLTAAQYMALAQANLGIGTLAPAGAAAGTVQTGAAITSDTVDPNGNRKTVVTLTAFSLGNDGNSASLAIGAKFFTFPAGTIGIRACALKGAFSTTDTANQAKTLQVGVGTVIASGAAAVLSGTATFQNVLSGSAPATGSDTASPDTNGTAMFAFSNSNGACKAAGSHDLFLNAAVAWSAGTPAPVLFTGTITIDWELVP